MHAVFVKILLAFVAQVNAEEVTTHHSIEVHNFSIDKLVDSLLDKLVANLAQEKPSLEMSRSKPYLQMANFAKAVKRNMNMIQRQIRSKPNAKTIPDSQFLIFHRGQNHAYRKNEAAKPVEDAPEAMRRASAPMLASILGPVLAAEATLASKLQLTDYVPTRPPGVWLHSATAFPEAEVKGQEEAKAKTNEVADKTETVQEAVAKTYVKGILESKIAKVLQGAVTNGVPGQIKVKAEKVSSDEAAPKAVTDTVTQATAASSEEAVPVPKAVTDAVTKATAASLEEVAPKAVIDTVTKATAAEEVAAKAKLGDAADKATAEEEVLAKARAVVDTAAKMKSTLQTFLTPSPVPAVASKVKSASTPVFASTFAAKTKAAEQVVARWAAETVAKMTAMEEAAAKGRNVKQRPKPWRLQPFLAIEETAEKTKAEEEVIAKDKNVMEGATKTKSPSFFLAPTSARPANLQSKMQSKIQSKIQNFRIQEEGEATAKGEVTSKYSLIASGTNLPHPKKMQTGGDDAWFVQASRHGGGVMAVADGVGSESRLYAQVLSDEVRHAYRPSVGLRSAIATAHHKTKVPGFATLCMVEVNGTKLHAANIGDSGFRIIRDGKVVFASRTLQHYFNCPYQLGNKELNPLTNTADDAEVFTFPAQPGDLVIVGSDGLFDNAFDADIARVATEAAMHGESTLTATKAASEALVKLARANAEDKNYESPYAVNSANYREGPCRGGKLDDITVVVGKVVVSTEAAKELNMAVAASKQQAASMKVERWKARREEAKTALSVLLRDPWQRLKRLTPISVGATLATAASMAMEVPTPQK